MSQNVFKEDNVVYIKREKRSHNYVKVRNKDFLDCFFFAWNMTYEGKGQHIKNERSTLQVFSNVLRGKLAEAFFYEKFNHQLNLSKPNYETYQLGQSDKYDFITSQNKKIDIKSLKSYSSMLLLDKEKIIESLKDKNIHVPKQDAYVIVKVTPDVFKYLENFDFNVDEKVRKAQLLKVLSDIDFSCSFSGFILEEDIRDSILNNNVIEKGSHINSPTSKQLNKDFLYIHLNETYSINKLKSKLHKKIIRRI